MAGSNIVDFVAYRATHRGQRDRAATLAAFALEMCERAFRRGDWRAFGRWHATYCRLRARAGRRGAPATVVALRRPEAR